MQKWSAAFSQIFGMEVIYVQISSQTWEDFMNEAHCVIFLYCD